MYFYKFADSQARSQLIKPMINKTTNLTALMSNSNTIESYFKKKPFRASKLKEAVLPPFKSHDNANQNTNSSYEAQLPVQANELDNWEDSGSNAIDFSKAKQIQMNLRRQEQCTDSISNTLQISRLQKVMINPLEDESTKLPSKQIKELISKQIKKEEAAQKIKNFEADSVSVLEEQTIKKSNSKGDKSHTANLVKHQTPHIFIPASREVEKIMNRPSLRDRYAHLIQDQRKFKIGYQHRVLLKVLSLLDSTIGFLTENRGTKFVFFSDLQKSFQNGKSLQITKKQLQQLLFIDKDLYSIEWAKNSNINNQYDLMFNPSRNTQIDSRVANTQKLIVNYLTTMELQFLLENNRQTKTNLNGWQQGFNPDKYEIPMMALPPHPVTKHAALSQKTHKQLQAIPNNHLRKFMLQMKEQQDKKSLTSQDVTKMIFQKKQCASIIDRINKELERKEEKNRQMVQMFGKESEVSKDIVCRVCEDLMMIYMSQGVSNMFKESLIDKLSKKVNLRVEQVKAAIQYMRDVKNINFLTEKQISDRRIIMSVNRTAYNQMNNYLKSLP